MPRRTPPSRLTDIAEAARKVFTKKGYRRTLMTDVGKELGLSHALLYKYVESKEALFQLALLAAILAGRPLRTPQPLADTVTREALRPVADWTAGNSTFSVLRAALTTDDCSDIRREFNGVVDEYYSIVENNRTIPGPARALGRRLPGAPGAVLRKVPTGAGRHAGGVHGTTVTVGSSPSVSRSGTRHPADIETVAWFAWHRREHLAPIEVTTRRPGRACSTSLPPRAFPTMSRRRRSGSNDPQRGR